MKSNFYIFLIFISGALVDRGLGFLVNKKERFEKVSVPYRRELEAIKFNCQKAEVLYNAFEKKYGDIDGNEASKKPEWFNVGAYKQACEDSHSELEERLITEKQSK
jgi:hypothetical protein